MSDPNPRRLQPARDEAIRRAAAAVVPSVAFSNAGALEHAPTTAVHTYAKVEVLRKSGNMLVVTTTLHHAGVPDDEDDA